MAKERVLFMKIFAFADEACPDIDGQIAAMSENRLDGIEIRTVDGVNVSDISDYKAKEVKTKMDYYGFKIWSIGSPIGKIGIEDDFKTHIEKFRRTLEIADILACENIRLFSFYIENGKNPYDYKNEVIEKLAVFEDIALGSKITLCHENEKGIYGDTYERCLEIHKAIPSIKAIFDPANYIQCGVDTKKAWEAIKPYVKYLHIKDALADGNVVPAGKGIGNIKYILDDFKAMGGNEITIEPHLKVFDGLAELENSGNTSGVGNVYRYRSNKEAFSAAVKAVNELL